MKRNSVVILFATAVLAILTVRFLAERENLYALEIKRIVRRYDGTYLAYVDFTNRTDSAVYVNTDANGQSLFVCSKIDQGTWVRYFDGLDVVGPEDRKKLVVAPNGHREIVFMIPSICMFRPWFLEIGTYKSMSADYNVFDGKIFRSPAYGPLGE